MRTRLSVRRPDRGLNHARSLVRQVCGIAGQATWVDDLQGTAIGSGLVGAVADHDTGRIFDWLIRELSYQGISDAVADRYIDRHGNVTWAEIEAAVATNPCCDKLEGYWAFTDCRYHKGFQTCANPAHFPGCPLPRHPLRNGRLNQTAYSLFLFIRDIAGGDIVGWIDQQLADYPGHRQPSGGPGRVGRSAAACLWDFRQGDRDGAGIAADGGRENPAWLVRRRGELCCRRYPGPQFPSPNRNPRPAWSWPSRMAQPATGQVAALTFYLDIASAIDARRFNPGFPETFPRFIASAIWRYCAEPGLDICNGNQIDDRGRCTNMWCRLYSRCDRLVLHAEPKAAEK